jgi:hypothetical protein
MPANAGVERQQQQANEGLAACYSSPAQMMITEKLLRKQNHSKLYASSKTE